MKTIFRFVTFSLLVGAAALSAVGQDQLPKKDVPKSPRVGVPDTSPPQSPATRSPNENPPKDPAAGSPDVDPPKSPRAGSPDVTPPKSPRAGSTEGGNPPKSPRAGSPDVTPPKSPRAGTPPGQRPTETPGKSLETRKPSLPGDNKGPVRTNVEPAPRQVRNPRPTDGTTRLRDNSGGKTDTPRSRDQNAVNPTDKPGRSNADGTRDADRNDIPSGFTKAADRNATDNRDRPVKQLRVDPIALRNDPTVSAAIKSLQNVRSNEQLEQAFAQLSDGRRDGQMAALDFTRVSGRFQTRLGSDDFGPLINSRMGQQYDLDRQFGLFAQGDVARQLSFNTTLVSNGGWQARHTGPVYSDYSRHAFSSWYPGPQWYRAYTWMPRWSPWVQWSFWNTVPPIYDPRPFVVRPNYYEAAPINTTYEYPVWQKLPVVASGTWVDLPPVSTSSGQDLQLLAVRFVDPGHVEEDLGPRYRVWLRNNSPETLNREFDVTVFASRAPELSGDIVQAGVTIPEIAGDDTIAVDIRLPAAANRLVVDENEDRVPFMFLHVVVDSRNSTKESDEENNGAVLKRGDVFPVDPAAFSTNVTAAAPGSTIAIAGEGLGPEPGEVIVTVGEDQYSATVRGWYDLGVQFIVPDLELRQVAEAQVLIIRGDGAASNPVILDIAPEESIAVLSAAPRPRN